MAHAASTGRFRPLLRTTPLALAPLLVALSFALPQLAHAAGTLPHGGQFVAGTGSITGNATSLTINQTSNRGIIDWKNFSIGSGNHVGINNGNGATLNRVTGADPTLILGSLTATGAIYLINPQGILVGRSGVISTGGRFLASTLDTENASFMNSGMLTFVNLSTRSASPKAYVVNNGNIGSTGGDVILIGTDTVDNVGTISAPSGRIEVGVGHVVTLQDSTVGQQIVVFGDSGTIVNRGTLEAAQINLQADDGNIFALAGNHSVVRATGTAMRDGHVWLVSNLGTIWMDGTIEAANADGSGGTVDADGRYLRLAGGPVVTAKRWNLTASDFKIDDVTSPVLRSNLDRGTSINVQTTGLSHAPGNIDVISNLDWSGAASLTLAAIGAVSIYPGVTVRNRGNGNLTLRGDALANDNAGAVVNDGMLDWSNSLGHVELFSDLNGADFPGNLLSNPSWTTPIHSGLLTQITDYRLVNSVADLAQIPINLAGNYALGRDIDLTGAQFQQIGDPLDPFTGQFDGQGHTISSLSLRAESDGTRPPWVGMFTSIGQNAIVRDLNLAGDALIEAAGAPNAPMNGAEGILAGYNAGTILRVNTSGTVGAKGYAGDGDLTIAGGLVGINAGTGTIWRSSSSADGSSGGTSGGLVGENDGTIVESLATGSVKTIEYPGANGPVSEGRPGGLVGNNTGTITASYATGAVSNQCAFASCSAGGLVYANSGTISQSFSTGAVTGGRMIGADGVPIGPQNFGIAAVNDGQIANNVYWDKDTTGTTIAVGSGTPFPAANGLTSAAMANPASFFGWDFSATGEWEMPAGDAHPILRWQLVP